MKKSNASDIITRAKIQLLLDQPFFATVAMRLDIQEAPQIKTMDTNGKRIRYNPAFVEALTLDEVKGVLAHEVMHVTNLHHLRRGERDPKRWNIAADYAINPLIQNANLSLPDGALLNPLYDNMSAEAIYNALPPGSPDDNDPNGDNDPGGTGGVEDSPAQSEAERNQEEAEIKQITGLAALAAKRAGKLPGFLEEAIAEALAPRINWREVLARFITETAKNDYTYKRPNPRYLPSGIYLPALESQEIGDFILILDTSISCDDEALKQFAGEMQELTAAFNKPFTVLHVDTKLQQVQTFDQGDTLTAKGRGGTDFRPGFDYIDEQGEQPAAVIYLTDGECNSYPAAPDYPVLWAVYGSMARHFKPPFGEVVPFNVS